MIEFRNRTKMLQRGTADAHWISPLFSPRWSFWPQRRKDTKLGLFLASCLRVFVAILCNVGTKSVIPLGACLLFFLCNAQALFAQAPYLGGEKDGYAHVEAVFMLGGDPVEQAGVRVFPNPQLQGLTLNVSAPDVRNKLDVLVHDTKGVLLWRNTFWDKVGDAVMYIPTQGFAAGEYLVEVRVDGRTTIRKVTITAP